MAETKCGYNDGPTVKGSALLALYGPTLLVHIGFDPNHDPVANPGGVPVPGIKNVQALVDTGASQSCIDSMLAVQLGLPLVNKAKVSRVHGTKEVNVYLAQVQVPSLHVTINGAFCAVDLKAGGQVHSALIGRTFLQSFHMVYEGNTGTVTIKAI